MSWKEQQKLLHINDQMQRCNHCGKFVNPLRGGQHLYTLPEHLTKFDYFGAELCSKCGVSYSDEYWIAWLNRQPTSEEYPRYMAL